MAGSISGNKIDLVESSGADLPPVGTTRLIRKGGVTMQSIDGAAFSAIGGGTVITDGVTLTGAGTGGSPLAVAVPLTLENTTTSATPGLILSSNVSLGLGSFVQFKVNGSEQGHIRADFAGGLYLMPTTAGVLYSPGESAVRFAWDATGLSFFGGTRRAQQAMRPAFTNNVGNVGTTDTLTDFAGTTYATDGPIIRGDINQMAIQLAAIRTALGSGGCSLFSP